LLVLLPIVTFTFPNNVSEVIRMWGYPCDEHVAVTSDGYYLSMQRIPHGLSNNSNTKGTVLLMHGLSSAADDWILNLPYQSLGFILADAGYDVWLGNCRGNGHSMSSKNYTSDQVQFWNFTWDEMAAIDLPTMINYILTVSGQQKLSYIGVSQGSCIGFAGFEDPALSSKVDLFIGVAPVAYVYHHKGLLLDVLAGLHLDELLELLGPGEFNTPDALHKLLPNACKNFPSLCIYVESFLVGPSNHMNLSRVEFYVHFEPFPTSVLNIAHWAQMARNNAFQKFDFGAAGNMLEYGQPTPPSYNLGKISKDLPIALFTGGDDYLADKKDVNRLISELPVPPVLHHHEPTYSHIDGIIGIDAYKDTFPLMLNLLQKAKST